MKRRTLISSSFALGLSSLLPHASAKDTSPLRFGVGLFQPDREKNDATYRPLAQHLEKRLVELEFCLDQRDSAGLRRSLRETLAEYCPLDAKVESSRPSSQA